MKLQKNGKTLAQNLFDISKRLKRAGKFEGARIVFNSAKIALIKDL